MGVAWRFDELSTLEEMCKREPHRRATRWYEEAVMKDELRKRIVEKKKYAKKDEE
jgi:hypothetical protein